MSEYNVSLRQVMLLQNTLENGGTAICQLLRPDASLEASVTIENDEATHHIKVSLGPLASSITLSRDPSTKYQSLRDFLQDLANGRVESGSLSDEAIALIEAQESVDEVIQAGHIAYVINTTNPTLPYGAVVTNDDGDICAAATGSSKEHLAENVRAKLWIDSEQLGKCA